MIMIKNTLKDYDMPDRIDASGNGLSVLICTAYLHHFNWMTYSAWYSVNKYLPNAKIAITCSRSTNIDSYLYYWIYKCSDLRYNLHKNVGGQFNLPYLNKIYGVYLALKEGLVKQPLVVLDADMMALRDISSHTLDRLNSVNFATTACPYKLEFASKEVGPLWFFNRVPLEKIGKVIDTVGFFKGQDHLDLLALSKVFGDEVETLNDLGNEVRDHEITTFTHYNDGCGNFTKKDWEKGKTVPPFNVSYALQSLNMSPNEKKVLANWGQMANLWDAINQIRI